MKTSDKYHKWIEWSDEDHTYLGKCPDLMTGIHGDDPLKLYAELCEVVDDVIRHFESEGRPLPQPKVRPMQDVAWIGALQWLRDGYEDGDPYADFLSPPVAIDADGQSEFMRTVLFVTEETKKGTSRAGQEYQDPLLVLTGREYADIRFDELHTRICDALKGRGPRVVAQSFTPDGGSQLILSDGWVIGTVGHKARAKIRVTS